MNGVRTLSAQTPDSDSTTPAQTPISSTMAKPVQSADLFNGGKSVCIEHRGEIYRLQTTKLGKLILTK